MGFDLQAHQELRRLSYTVNCLVRDFCCRAKRCFGISDTGNPTLVLNQQGDWVSATGSARNGLSVDSGYVELGGEIIKETAVSFDGGTDQPTGLFFLPDGAEAPVVNKAVLLGTYLDETDLSKTNGVVALYSESTGVIATNVGNPNAIGEFVTLPDGSGQIDLEVVNSAGDETTALAVKPKYLTFGVYGDDLFLNIDAEAEDKYEIGDINGHTNGTFISIDNLRQVVKITKVPVFANDADAIAGGLVTGELYKTTTLGVTALNIVP
jgi:hypothetical protein